MQCFTEFKQEARSHSSLEPQSTHISSCVRRSKFNSDFSMSGEEFHYLELLACNLILQKLGELPFLATLNNFQSFRLLLNNVCGIKALDLKQCTVQMSNLFL